MFAAESTEAQSLENGLKVSKLERSRIEIHTKPWESGSRVHNLNSFVLPLPRKLV